jgi:hypothetical protein
MPEPPVDEFELAEEPDEDEVTELGGETDEDEVTGLDEERGRDDELQLVEEVVEELDGEPLTRYRPAPTPTTRRMTITAAGITNLFPLLPLLLDTS